MCMCVCVHLCVCGVKGGRERESAREELFKIESKVLHSPTFLFTHNTFLSIESCASDPFPNGN